MKTLVINKRARYDYEILETYEAGLKLLGNEVKAIKGRRANLKGSFVRIHNREAWLLNAHISPYQANNTPEGYEPETNRKLLLHKSEITKLTGKIQQKGLTLIPLRLYNKKGKIKLEFGLAKGKKLFDKREAIKKREFKREKARIMKNLKI